MSPANKRDTEDRVSYALRLSLYATCIVVPFIALITGALEASQTVASALALLGATTGGVAMTQARKDSTTADAAYRRGLTADTGPPGRHSLEHPDERH